MLGFGSPRWIGCRRQRSVGLRHRRRAGVDRRCRICRGRWRGIGVDRRWRICRGHWRGIGVDRRCRIGHSRRPLTVRPPGLGRGGRLLLGVGDFGSRAPERRSRHRGSGIPAGDSTVGVGGADLRRQGRFGAAIVPEQQDESSDEKEGRDPDRWRHRWSRFHAGIIDPGDRVRFGARGADRQGSTGRGTSRPSLGGGSGDTGRLGPLDERLFSDREQSVSSIG